MDWIGLIGLLLLVILPFVGAQFFVLGWRGVVVIIGWLAFAMIFKLYTLGFYVAVFLYLAFFLSGASGKDSSNAPERGWVDGQ